jgi:outer membrane phospholipase A
MRAMSALWKSLLFMNLLLLAAAPVGASVLLSPREVSVSQNKAFDKAVVVDVVDFNEDSTPLSVSRPPDLAAVLHAGTLASDEIVMTCAGSPDDFILPPGGLRRTPYTFRLPVGRIGPVVLEVPGLGCQPVMFSIQSAPLAQEASRVPVEGKTTPEEKLAHESALRRSTRLLAGVAAHEPVFFGIGASDGLNAKFQLSLKYNPFDLVPVYMGYTQTSIWDLHSTSKPFRDTAYRPSLFYQDDTLFTLRKGRFRLGYQGGFEHESNGKGGEDSRSINILFLRPRVEYRINDNSRLVFAPKIYGYIEKSENPDIGDYRGYCDFSLAYYYRDWRLSTILRKGVRANYGSVQVDAVFPLHSSDEFLEKVGVRGMNGYFFIQYFDGWGESILDYRRKLHSQVRAGLMVVP